MPLRPSSSRASCTKCLPTPRLFQALPCSRSHQEPTHGGYKSIVLPFPQGKRTFSSLIFLARPQMDSVFPTPPCAAAAAGPHKPLPRSLCFVLHLQSLQLIPKTLQLLKKHGIYGTSRSLAQQDPEPQAREGTLHPSSVQTGVTAPNPGKHKAALITAPAAAC